MAQSVTLTVFVNLEVFVCLFFLMSIQLFAWKTGPGSAVWPKRLVPRSRRSVQTGLPDLFHSSVL